MMHPHPVIFWLLCASLLAGCARQEPAPPPAPPSDAAAHATTVSDDTQDAPRAKLNGNGMAADYSARFEAGQLVRIDEERQAQGGAALPGEYTYQGARLLRYRGARLTAPATLDLQFDMQGALLSGGGPDLDEAEVAAIRNRAQLLRSHALAQRASREHGSY